jgi:hypothetical protein
MDLLLFPPLQVKTQSEEARETSQIPMGSPDEKGYPGGNGCV